METYRLRVCVWYNLYSPPAGALILVAGLGGTGGSGLIDEENHCTEERKNSSLQSKMQPCSEAVIDKHPTLNEVSRQKWRVVVRCIFMDLQMNDRRLECGS